MCNMYSSEKNNMMDHYRTAHDIVIRKDNINFDTFEQFEKWKLETEKDTCSRFIKFRTKQSSIKSIYYYRCHRDGFFKKSGKNIRHLKLMGSNKINGYCPAKMDVSVLKKTGKVEVNFIKTHVGHGMDIGRLSLSKSDREEIAAKITQKIPFDEILNNVRDSVSNNKLERIHLLTRKDLFNIERCFNLHSESVRHKSDYISVESWITEMRENSGLSVVRIYKEQGERHSDFPELQEQDFLLVIMNDAQLEILKKFGKDCVCIDGTHGTNAYDFELTTILVLDELRQGFPCVFIFSNRSDAVVFRIVFNVIKGLCCDLKPKVFMSDLSEAYYNAWCDVLGTVQLRLFCSWHVDRAWRKNVKEKIKNLEKQAYAYKLVRTLMEERDITAFETMLYQAVAQMLNDSDLKMFGEYFQSYYVSNKESWAYAYRLHSGLNTNMHLERMHKTLKYIYLKGKVGKRLDKTINIIMKFIRDKLFDRIITFNKGKISSKMNSLRNRHKAASKHSDYQILQEGDDWNVLSSNGKEFYHIQSTNSLCMCDLRCAECGKCAHAYICSCVDNSIKWNMCKHIHLVCQYLKNSQNEVSEAVSDNNNNNELIIACNPKEEEEQIILSELIVNKSAENRPVEALRESLRNSFNSIVLDVINAEGFKVVDRALLPLKPILSTLKNKSSYHFPQINDENRKCQIKPQRNFASTKKKKIISSSRYSVPTTEEKDVIAVKLLN